MTARAAAIRLEARTIARAQDEAKRRKRWLDWMEKALDERAAAEFEAGEGAEVAERMVLLDESFDIACGSDPHNGLVVAARHIFDAEVVEE